MNPIRAMALVFGILAGTPLQAESVGDARPPSRELRWPAWRGPLGTGEAPGADPPTTWSETENVRWKTPLPGAGHGTPVVWGNRIFVTTAVPFGEVLPPLPETSPGAHDNLPVTRSHKFVVLAVDRKNGAVLWERSVRESLPHESIHNSGTYASGSPVTDGEHVYAFFGSAGLYSLTVDGKSQWKVDFGDMLVKHGHGEGSSPALYGDTLVINWDHEGNSFVVAIDKRSGKQRWRVERNEVTSWASPIVVEHEGKPQAVVSGTGRIRGYDLTSGETLWECGGLSANVVATPLSADGVVYAASSYEIRAMLAIRLAGAQGDISNKPNVLWRRHRGTPYVPSPLLYDGALYFLGHYQNVLWRLEATSGEERPGPLRLPGLRNIYASPVAAAGRVYVTDRDGSTIVLTHGEAPELLALNRLNDSFSASAAIVGKEMFLRGEKFLYCLADD